MFQTSNLYQNDPKWTSIPLGNQSAETIGSWGCLLTSMTMMLNGLGYQETPVTVNDKMKANGGFQGALIIPVVLPVQYPNVVYRTFTPCTNSPAPLADIDAALAAGKPVIVQVDWSPTVGIQTHWVLIKDKAGNDYSIYDPYRYPGDDPTKDVLLAQRYKYQGASPLQAISGVIWFEGTGAPSAPPQASSLPVPANALTLYVAEDDLALRASPDISGFLYKRLMAGTPLTCLEDPSSAGAKVGQTGQWMNIQDPSGQQGFVAAWYVSTTQPAPSLPLPTPIPPPSPAPTTTPPGSTPLVVSPTMDGLTLRSQPVISAQTVIKYESQTDKLTVLEPAEAAAAKIGVQGQWLNVSDSTNQTGYVAAWYVQVVSGNPNSDSAPVVTTPPSDPSPISTHNLPAPTPLPNAIIVHTTAAGVALRSRPVVSEATLIKRLAVGAQLTLLDPGSASKIGVMDQWLYVQDSTGKMGYIAAWFIAK